jgi:uncharacterized protein (TIGR03435 family)
VPSFDVASFKRVDRDPRHGATREVTPTSVTIRQASLGNLIYWAYGYEHFQVVGPSWRDYPTEIIYTISAKAASPVTDSDMKLMLQNLLKERLGLVFHLETRDLPVYALMIDRSGPKFRESASTGEMSRKLTAPHVIRFERISMNDFAKTMDPPFTSRHVVDETGLPNIYDFTLDLTPYVTDAEGKPILDNRGAIDNEGAHVRALPKQLGLKLERKIAPLEVMVIDRVEKVPSAN